MISKLLPVAKPDTGWKPMLHYTVAWWLWALGTPVRKHFEISLGHSGEQSSIGFQPVSGFGAETGLNPNGPFRVRTFPNRPYLRAIQPRVYPC
jgi:hypothetical protein